MPFFLQFFSEKIASLIPIFCQENVHSQKKTLFSSQYFIKKRAVSQKHYFDVIFSKFSRKTLCCQAHIWSKKRQFCQNYTILWAKKVDRMPFKKNARKYTIRTAKKSETPVQNTL